MASKPATGPDVKGPVDGALDPEGGSDLRVSAQQVSAVPVLWRGDVVVAGGGSAGCAAAVAAARNGARVLLIDSAGFPGGTGTAVLDIFNGFYPPDSADRVVEGIGWEVCRRLVEKGQAFERANDYGAGTGVTYEPEALKVIWDELLTSAGVDLLFHTTVTRAVLAESPRRMDGLVIETRRGPARVEAGIVIDATGDGDIAWRAGCEMRLKPESGRRLQPLTTMFRIGGVAAAHASTAELEVLMRAAAASGEYSLPRLDGSLRPTGLPGVMHTNLTRVVGIDATDPWELSRAEVEGRRQVAEYVRFLRDRVPGFRDSYLLSTGVRIGVRETRRLVGRYVLSRDDVLSARNFPDSIARCAAPVEEHDDETKTSWEYIDSDGARSPSYGIPFRALLPKDVGGLIVAGRCLSATHDAHASVRSMAQCMAMGHAAGTAAALAAASGTDVGDCDVDLLRKKLVTEGALV